MCISVLELGSGLGALAWLTALKVWCTVTNQKKMYFFQDLKESNWLEQTEKNKGVADILKLVHKFLDPLTLYL